MQNRILCVKCSVDGELPQKRKARLTIWSPHPLQHTDDSNISIVKGYKKLLFIPDDLFTSGCFFRAYFTYPVFTSRHSTIILFDIRGGLFRHDGP